MTVRLLPGIEEVVADFKTRSAFIRFDPSQVELETIQLALADIGYDANPQAK